jgi:dihydropteroate synthase
LCSVEKKSAQAAIWAVVRGEKEKSPMNRKMFYWKARNSELALGERTLIMGILNVTPDSFSDGGLFHDPDRAWARALELEEQGADIIDIGAESTRPGSARISAEEEWQRLVPVLKRLRGNLHVPLSIDTYKSATAERALDYGVDIINDPSGLTFDANLAKIAASANAGLILTHMRGTPETWAKLPPLPDAPSAIARDLDATVNRARRAGVEHNRIVIDPGLGFGKRGDQNSEILAHLNELARLDLPILVGPSRKSFLHQKTSEETLFATAAAAAAAILNGAYIIRVHDVKEIRAVALVADEIARAAAVVRVSLERASPQKAERPKMQRPGIERGPAPMPPQIPRPPLLRPQEARSESPAAEAAPASNGRPEKGERSESRPPQRNGPPFDRGRSAPPRKREFGGSDDERRRGPARSGGPAGDRPREQGDRRFPRREGGPGGRPPGNRFKSDRPQGDAPRGDRPQNDRPRGDRPPGDRFRDRERGPGGDRPRQQGDSRGTRSGPPRNDQRGAGGAGPRTPRPPKRVFRKRP